jgi:hypothetical protein
LESRRRREAQQNALEAQAEQPAELQNSVVSILQIDPVRTGAPGRPTGSHLVLAEFEKRMSQGMREQTVKAESERLHEWYLRNHPTLPNLTRGAIENKIRVKFRESAPQK